MLLKNSLVFVCTFYDSRFVKLKQKILVNKFMLAPCQYTYIAWESQHIIFIKFEKSKRLTHHEVFVVGKQQSKVPTRVRPSSPLGHNLIFCSETSPAHWVKMQIFVQEAFRLWHSDIFCSETWSAHIAPECHISVNANREIQFSFQI